jgi:hypothetical protein
MDELRDQLKHEVWVPLNGRAEDRTSEWSGKILLQLLWVHSKVLYLEEQLMDWIDNIRDLDDQKG